MDYLKMYFLPSAEFKDLTLPSGYSLAKFSGEKDIAPWIECCKNGILADDADKAVFDYRITEHPDTVAQRDIYFIDYNGEHIATVTAIFHSSSNTGEIHMLSVRSDCRGKGLAKHLISIAISALLKNEGIKFIELKTMEFRKAAIKSYLKNGFHPVEYSSGMCERWCNMLMELEIEKADMLNEDGSFYKTVYASRKQTEN